MKIKILEIVSFTLFIVSIGILTVFVSTVADALNLAQNISCGYTIESNNNMSYRNLFKTKSE